jgi:ribosomal protein L19E
MALYPRNNPSTLPRDAGIPAGQPSTVGAGAGNNNRYQLGAGWGTADVRNHNGTNEYTAQMRDLGRTVGDIIGGIDGNTPTLPGTDPGLPGNTGDTPTTPTGYYPTTPSRPDYTAPTLPGANSQADYINAMYDANRRAQEDSLRSAYEQQVNVLNDQANRLPSAYNAAADQVAAQAAIQQRNFNEQAAASGLNTGAGSQARLDQNNAYLGNIRQVRQAQADAEANLNLQRAQLETQYRNAIADAIAQNDLQRAQALYQEAVRVDESITNTAINQANMDWQVWNALYNR